MSSSHHGGPSSNQRVHVPAGVKGAKRVIAVEGIMKACVVHALSRRAIIGLSGCNVTDEAIAALRVLDAHEVLLAVDADARGNCHVALAQVEGLARLNAAGFDGGLLRWDESLGKGLDDALLAYRKREATALPARPDLPLTSCATALRSVRARPSCRPPRKPRPPQGRPATCLPRSTLRISLVVITDQNGW
jgi:hypothetical protein